jgi:hypothetical protein
MKQMKVKDEGEIWFAIFTFAGSSGIDDTMLALARGGVKVRGPRSRSGKAEVGRTAVAQAHEHRAPHPEEGRGARGTSAICTTSSWSSTIEIVVAGSFNYTKRANEYNDENLFVIGSPHEEVEGITVEADPVKKVARHFRDEIERLYGLSKKFVPG